VDFIFPLCVSFGPLAAGWSGIRPARVSSCLSSGHVLLAVYSFCLGLALLKRIGFLIQLEFFFEAGLIFELSDQ
jgi:hypothetical protein